MTLPMILTLARIALAPVFYLVYQMAGADRVGLVAAAWVVFVLIEVSDLLDGYFARKLNQVSEIGKVLDPFADSLSRLTYFVAFAGSGIMPWWILLVVIYRDVGVAYIRVLMSRQKVLMPARLSGKVKAWVYALAGIAGLAEFSARALAVSSSGLAVVHTVTFWLFVSCGAIAIWSLIDYAGFFAKNFEKAS
jgi:CDP-diacylglycerol---glycerol-3-phosphate 3-phosphatidyltransferase